MVRSYLDRVCGSDWQQTLSVLVVPVSATALRNSRDCHDLASAVHTLFGMGTTTVPPPVVMIAPSEMQPTSQYWRGWQLGGDFEVISAHAMANETSSRLARSIRRAGADWMSNRSAELLFWEHGAAQEKVSIARVTEWLNQFDRCAPGHKFVGEGLLRGFTLLSSHDFLTSIDPDSLPRNARISVALDKRSAGGSGARLASLLEKELGRSIHDLSTAIAEAKDGEPIVWVEDGLWGGIEFVGVLESLAGERTVERQKVPPLPNPSRLKEVNLQLRFACATDLGLARVHQEITRRGLPNISIQKAKVTHPILTPQGHAFLASEQFFTNGKYPVCSDPDRLMTSVANRGVANLWRDISQCQRAIQLCREIGRDLWVSYLNSKSWLEENDQRPEAWALGANGIFSLTGFAHSIPKACSPLFWAEGDVRLGSRMVKWRPLFPNAAN
jgi:hypothetical protein